jgi:AraC family transcriptional regulator
MSFARDWERRGPAIHIIPIRKFFDIPSKRACLAWFQLTYDALAASSGLSGSSLARGKTPSVQVADLPTFARLIHRKYRPQAKPEECENKFKDFLFILPIRHGRIWLAKEDTVLFDGIVKPGVVRFVRPGEHARVRASEAFESAVLRIPPRALAMAAETHGCKNGQAVVERIAPVIEARYDIQRLVPLLGTACEASGPRQRLLASGIALALLGLIMQDGQDRSSRPMTGFASEQFEAAVSFANAHLANRLDLGEWASSVQMSSHEFARRFQQHTGVAPYTWFLDRRVDFAKQLLLQAEIPLVEVAFDAGFCSQSHFTEAFKQRVGMSPGRWRILHGERQNAGETVLERSSERRRRISPTADQVV